VIAGGSFFYSAVGRRIKFQLKTGPILDKEHLGRVGGSSAQRGEGGVCASKT